MDEEPEDEIGGCCSCCGEPCAGSPYVLLWGHSVHGEDGIGVGMRSPFVEDEPSVVLHLTCVSNFFDGLHASIGTYMREQS